MADVSNMVQQEDDNPEVLDTDRLSTIVRRATLRNNAARQIAVNFMPSRQLPHNTLRLRRSNSEHNALLEEQISDAADPDRPDAAEKQADIIVREMEQHRRLMEDNPAAEELRREALRDLPQGLTMKRHVRAKLSASVSLRSKRRPISMWRSMKYRISFAWKRAKDRSRDFFFSIELWYEAIRNIEGQFGSAVGSYFYFLRWVFAVDLLVLVMLLCFLVVPQVLYDDLETSGRRDGGWGVLDFISGKGSYAHSVLFYGHYHRGDISARGPLSYNMPFAYFFTMTFVYLVIFAVMCYRTAYSYRRNFIETAAGGLSHAVCSKVFCGWDFGIMSPRAAALSHHSLWNDLRELLNEQNKNKATPSFCIKFYQYLVNTVITIIVLAAVGGIQYGFWQLLSVDDMTSRWEILLSLVITAVIAVMPVIFNFIVRLEYYSPRVALYVTLLRTWLLDMGTLMLLFYYWTQSDYKCWETAFGQETYRLVLLDSLVSLLILPAIEVIRAFIFKMHPTSSPPEFNLAYNSLTLIYNQCVVWAGMLFSPLLVAAVTIKLLLLFYVKRVCLKACTPAGKIWRAAQTQTVLYMLATLSLFTTLFALGSLFFKMPSQHCGPFASYGHVFEVLTEGVLGLAERHTLRHLLQFITRPGVIAFLMLFLSVAVYYMRAKARAQNSMVEILRHMLVLQAKDKDFLLNAIAKVSNGEWCYSPKDDEGPDSHTWKYLKEVRKPSNSGFHLDASRLSQRPKSYINDRPGSYYDRQSSYFDRQDKRRSSDGETDSSFSWKGSNSCLDQTADVEQGKRD